MRILTALNIGYPVVGGAQITHQTYLKGLAREFGHACGYLDAARTRPKLHTGAVKYGYFRDTVELRAKVAAARANVLIGGFTLVQDAVKIGHALGIPVIGWMNSYEYCPPTQDEAWAWQLSHTHRYPGQAAREFALAHADALVVNSKFLQHRMIERYGITPRVIYPAFDPQIAPRANAGTERPFILGVCGYPHKGAGIFLELAHRFPQQQFLLAGSVHAEWYDAFRAQSNITLSAFRPMRELLAQAKMALVPSQWDEPFGRIAIEAMALGIPTLVSDAAGLAEIVEGGVQGVREYRSIEAWSERVKELLEKPAARDENRETGLEIAARFLGPNPIAQVDALVRELVSDRQAGVIGIEKGAPCVRQLVGDTEALSAFALINRRILAGWQEREYRFHSTRTTDEFVAEPVDVVIHHDYTQEFRSIPTPAEGKFVVIRTWDFGPYPPAWVERINAECDQLWVNSQWVAGQAIASGVLRRRVRVIPWGIDPEMFRPKGAVYPLATEKQFKFLFVGGSISRKGFGILLHAYRAAFTSADDVVLVVKDNPRDVFYKGEKQSGNLAASPAADNAPALVVLDAALDIEELAALYRACDVGVFPYRAEGFALPILEAMACGTPSIVPRFGACLDYCLDATSFFVTPKHIRLPIAHEFVYNSLGFKENIAQVDFCEVSVPELARVMREVYEQWKTDPTAIQKRASRGVQRAHTRFTWKHTVDQIDSALGVLGQTKIPVRMRERRHANEKQRRIFETARALYLGLPESKGLPIRPRQLE